MVEQRSKVKKMSTAIFAVLACWLLTLGLFVERDLSFEFVEATDVEGLQDCKIRTRVSSNRMRTFGLPYVFSYKCVAEPFGVVLLVQCKSSKIEEIVVTGITVNGVEKRLSEPLYLARSDGGSYGAVFRGTLDAQLSSAERAYQLVLSGTCTANGQQQMFSAKQLVVPVYETRSSIGWMMLLYYSQF